MDKSRFLVSLRVVIKKNIRDHSFFDIFVDKTSFELLKNELKVWWHRKASIQYVGLSSNLKAWDTKTKLQKHKKKIYKKNLY